METISPELYFFLFGFFGIIYVGIIAWAFFHTFDTATVLTAGGLVGAVYGAFFWSLCIILEATY